MCETIKQVSIDKILTKYSLTGGNSIFYCRLQWPLWKFPWQSRQRRSWYVR